MSVKITLLITLTYTLLKFTNTNTMTGFIVGGNYSAIESFPYAVFISKYCNEKNSSCGASILTQEILLSAAHCYYACYVPFRINAYTGAVKKFHGLESKVINYKVHEEYLYNKKSHDIALLRLEIPLIFGNSVKRVALMKTPPESDDAMVAGWGWIDSIGTRDDRLKHAYQKVLDHEACNEILIAIPNGTICGREKTGLSYPEKGDSGSALIIHNLIQIGIVSYKKRTFTNDTIVYTYVPYYFDWIKEKTRELMCSTNEIETHQPMNSTSIESINVTKQ